MIEALERIVLERVSAAEDRRAWFERALGSSDPGALLSAFSIATRKLGADQPSDEETAGLTRAGLGWLASQDASLDMLGRVVLLLRAVELASDPSSAVAEWYRQGDSGEKRAVLRALALLPAPSRFVEVAVNACRTSVQSVFEAICCENPYPASELPEPAFNQMVLKALFTGVALARIVRIDDRKNAELARMAAGYASERRAAGRSVPEDIGRVLASEPPQQERPS